MESKIMTTTAFLWWRRVVMVCVQCVVINLDLQKSDISKKREFHRGARNAGDLS